MPGSQGLRRCGSVAVASVVLWSGAAVAASASQGAGATGALTGAQLVARSEPAVRAVFARLTAEVSVPPSDLVPARVEQAYSEASALAAAGQIGSTRGAITDYVLDAIEADPGRYIVAVAGDVISEKVSVTSQGSGFFVTPNGHLVTNAHVISEEDLSTQAALAFLDGQDRRQAESVARSNGALSDKERQRLTGAFVDWDIANLSVTTKKLTYAVAADVTPAEGPATLTEAPAVLVATSMDVDAAILKVDAENLSTLPLSSATTADVGDRVFAIGYPGDATFNKKVFKETQAEPSLTSGVLSARKKLASGRSVLQTDAALTHGNSGGPVLDEQGAVLGLATFGAVDSDSGKELAGFNFVLPSADLAEFFKREEITPRYSRSSQLYAEALREMDRRYYERALPLLTEVRRLDTGHPYVQRRIVEAKEAIDSGKDETPTSFLGVPLTVVVTVLALGVVLSLAVGLVLVASTARRRRPPQLAAGPPLHPNGSAQFSPSAVGAPAMAAHPDGGWAPPRPGPVGPPPVGPPPVGPGL